MIDLKNISSIYFAGIGGIGMSALARYFNERGVNVIGYDKTATILTQQLIDEGIKIHFEDNLDLINKKVDAVVYTPAIPATHTALNFYKENNYDLLKRSDVLGLLTKDSFNICVAGTHGKTTTSAMIAHILRDSSFGCTAFLGGIAANYNTNFWSSTNNVSVVEADEYDRSFLKLQPNIAVITSMDADHLDIYGDEETMQNAFIDFTKKIKTDGTLIVKDNIKRLHEFKADNIITYNAFSSTADVHTENLRIENGSYFFDIVIKQKRIENVQLNMGGLHNIENATAAIVVADSLGIDEIKIKNAVANFQGVKRRFEYIIKTNELVMIDDYAHHPEELRALINGAKKLFPQKKCTVIFQPHLYSRTKDLVDGFAAVLSLADEVFLLPIYPARELPIEGVTSELIVKKMKDKKAVVCDKEEIISIINKIKISGNNLELLIIAGAGDIDTLIQPIKNLLIK